MCYSPIYIPNPTFKHDKHKIYRHNPYLPLENTNSKTIAVPCGVCKQCVAIAQMEMAERIQMEALNNRIFMGTMTYKNETLPRLETPMYEDKHGKMQPGYIYRYAKYEDASAMMKRMRAKKAFEVPFKYLVVSERGSKRARPHFHCLILIRNEYLPTYNDCINFEQRHKWTILENWKRNIGTRNNPQYQELCEYHESWQGRKLRRNYDFHYINPALTKGGVTDAAFYVLKYMLKGIQEKDTKRALLLNYDARTANEIWERIKNRREYSLGFGLDIDWSKNQKDRTIKEEICNPEIIKYIRDGIARSLKAKTEYAYYYCPESINTFPLANYYKKFPFIYDNDMDFYKICPERYNMRMYAGKEESDNAIDKQIADFERIIQQTSLLDVADTFDENTTKYEWINDDEFNIL